MGIIYFVNLIINIFCYLSLIKIFIIWKVFIFVMYGILNVVGISCLVLNIFDIRRGYFWRGFVYYVYRIYLFYFLEFEVMIIRMLLIEICV